MIRRLFVAVDGGMPMRDGLLFVNNALLGTGVRDQIRIIAAGKIGTGFHMVRAIALGADLWNVRPLRRCLQAAAPLSLGGRAFVVATPGRFNATPVRSTFASRSCSTLRPCKRTIAAFSRRIRSTCSASGSCW